MVLAGHMGRLPGEDGGDSRASRRGCRGCCGVSLPPLGPKGSFFQWRGVLRADVSQLSPPTCTALGLAPP